MVTAMQATLRFPPNVFSLDLSKPTVLNHATCVVSITFRSHKLIDYYVSLSTLC